MKDNWEQLKNQIKGQREDEIQFKYNKMILQTLTIGESAILNWVRNSNDQGLDNKEDGVMDDPTQSTQEKVKLIRPKIFWRDHFLNYFKRTSVKEIVQSFCRNGNI